ncbi:hypothetical protein DFP86_1125 [Paludibacterium purpuratum]|uniref:Uncharacterized protein n=2 Tax=Paludibacterium purpuratum TaxID=1144873 RepID=A0A4R7AZE0_9NEIS|nr:hypothetical protein DFP86_1125 [Paludibacterium purpuratum]
MELVTAFSVASACGMAYGQDMLTVKDSLFQLAAKQSNVLGANGMKLVEETSKKCKEIGSASLKGLQVSTYEKVFTCTLDGGTVKVAFHFDYTGKKPMVDRFGIVTAIADYDALLKYAVAVNGKDYTHDDGKDYQSAAWTINKKGGIQISLDLSKYFVKNATIYQVDVNSGN